MSPSPPQAQDEPQLLEMMLADAAGEPSAYRPTNYWAVYQRRFLPELRRLGLHDFRRRKESVLSSFGATDLSSAYRIDLAKSRALNNCLTRRLPFWSAVLDHSGALLQRVLPLATPYHTTAEDVLRLAYAFTRLQGVLAGAKPLEAVMTSLVGNPEHVIRVGDRLYSFHLLDAYLRYVYCSRFISFDRLRVIVELGSGAGTQLEVLKQLYPEVCLIAFDLPPRLYVCEAYLKSVFGRDVISYAKTRQMASLPVEPGTIVLCGTWKFPLLKEIAIDLFWSSATFQEMEPEVAAHYLAVVNHAAQAAYLRQSMDGKEIARKPGAHGVLRQTTLADYRRGLSRFQLIDLSPAVLPTTRRSGYHDSLWRNAEAVAA